MLTATYSPCRYCYQAQPQVMQWNLAQLASAFLAAELCTKDEAQAAIDEYGVKLVGLHGQGWAAKLGLKSYDEGLATRYMKLMEACECDFTNTFRALTALSHEQQFSEMPADLASACGKDLTDADREVWARCCRPPSLPVACRITIPAARARVHIAAGRAAFSVLLQSA